MKAKIQNLGELEHVLSNENLTNKGVLDFFSVFKIDRLLKPFESIKSKGFRINFLLLALILFRLRGKSIYSMQKVYNLGFEADDNSFYRLMNNSKMDWRGLLMSFAKQFVKITLAKCEKSFLVRCIVVDDTDLGKTGKTIEFIGKIYNHVLQRSILGFKMLTLCFSDGKSLIPVDFSLHREKGKAGNHGMSKKEKKAQFQ